MDETGARDRLGVEFLRDQAPTFEPNFFAYQLRYYFFESHFQRAECAAVLVILRLTFGLAKPLMLSRERKPSAAILATAPRNPLLFGGS